MKQSVQAIKTSASQQRDGGEYAELLKELRSLRQEVCGLKERYNGSMDNKPLMELARDLKIDMGKIREQIASTIVYTPQHANAEAQDLIMQTRRPQMSAPITLDPQDKLDTSMHGQDVSGQLPPVDVFGPIVPIRQSRPTHAVAPASTKTTTTETTTAPQVEDHVEPVYQLSPLTSAEAVTASTSSSSSEASNKSGSWKPEAPKAKASHKRKLPPKPVTAGPIQTKLPTTMTGIITPPLVTQDRSSFGRVLKKSKLAQTEIDDALPVITGYDLGIMTRGRSASVKQAFGVQSPVNGAPVTATSDPIVIGSSSDDSIIIAAQTGGFVPGIEANNGPVGKKKIGRPSNKAKTDQPVSKQMKAELVNPQLQSPHDSLDSLNSQNLDPNIPSSNPTRVEVDDAEDYLMETQMPNEAAQSASIIPEPESFVEGQRSFVPRLPPQPMPITSTRDSSMGTGRFQRLDPESPDLPPPPTALRRGLKQYGSRGGRGDERIASKPTMSRRFEGLEDLPWDASLSQ
jgi:hypothetical protein